MTTDFWAGLRAASWYAQDEAKAVEAEKLLAEFISSDLAAWYVRHYPESQARDYIRMVLIARSAGTWTSDPGSGGVPLLSDGGTDLGCYWIKNTDTDEQERLLALAEEWS